MKFSAQQLSEATNGWIKQSGPPGPITTDTRALSGGEWFLPLVGERFDAHDFLDKAAEKGCLGVIASRVPEGWSLGWIKVPDTLEALQSIAAFARQQFRGQVVGITGSAGKTTLREMVSGIAGLLGPCHSTKGNFNNHIGLPLSILAATGDEKTWVLEMGMNHLGEIALLQQIAQPNIRIITNVGEAHTEGVGSIEGVAKAKGELFDGAEAGDCCCINLDDAHIPGLTLPKGIKSVSYGQHPDADIRLLDVSINPTELTSAIDIQFPNMNRFKAIIPSPSAHLAHNGCAAATIGYLLGATQEQISLALSAYTPVGARMNIQHLQDGIVLLDDAYNANPLSMKASIDTLASLKGRRVALLGDMLELGKNEIETHQDILEYASKKGIDLIAVAGPRFTLAAKKFPTIISAETAITLAEAIRDLVKGKDRILLKGSRGMRMEKCIEALGLKGQGS